MADLRTLVVALQRVARYLDGQATALEAAGAGADAIAVQRGRAQTCWQAAARLDHDPAPPPADPPPPVVDDEPWRAPHSKRAMQERLGVSGDVDE